MVDGLIRIQVEDRLARRMPAAAVEEEDRRGVTQVRDGGKSFHVASLNGLELYGDADQGRQVPGSQVAGKGGSGFPFEGLPAQAARFAACGCGPEEGGLQLRSLMREF